MMLGYLLARAGVAVVVLEKHGDFLRDFRGDTIHPSTLEVMHELGLLDDFLKRPHQRLTEVRGVVGTERVVVADFSRLRTHCRFLVFMPQWDFLDFLAGHARRFPSFTLCMNADVVDLVRDGDRVSGVVAQTPGGALTVHAHLVIGADGRSSVVREKGDLEVERFGVPIDVLWMRISKGAEPSEQTFGRIANGAIMVTLDRGDYWQCAYVIRKGAFEAIRTRGIAAFREDVATLAPHVREHVGELTDWDQIKLLTVRVDRLRQWHRPGLLCIGDAAHAMSPIGGVGINLAIQDAVAAANILVGPLAANRPTDDLLPRVQRRRMLPTRLTQGAQVLIQNRVFGRILEQQGDVQVPFVVKLLQRYPALRGIPARLVGIGVRPEHVRG
jgi:2-polyprenyl-6-methoxyphenol hydroxylase-like FAD-dependent oxidoreductase